MVDDRASPSAGWRAVCDEMAVETDVENPNRRCPACDRSCENVVRDAYECPEHGVFRQSVEDAGSDRSEGVDAEESDDPRNRTGPGD